MEGNAWRGIALVCNRQGEIVHVVEDAPELLKGRSSQRLDSLLDAASVGKCQSFFETLRTQRGAFDWLMNVRAGSSLFSLHFAGIAMNQEHWVVGARDRGDIEMLFNNLAANRSQRADEQQTATMLLRDEAAKSASDDGLLDEMSRLNNEMVNLHRQLAKKNVELERLNEELSEYNHFISHDIRAPLRAIKNYVSFLGDDLDGKLDDEQQQYLDGLRKAASQASDLVRDLHRVTGIDREDLRWTTVGMNRLINDVFDSVGATQDAEFVLAGDLPAIESDASLLRQLFENLIINAVKFNRSPRPRVEVGVESDRAHDSICFYVRDNGIGIDSAYHKQIFSTFERLHSEADFAGTGIGLAIVKRAIDRLGGQINLDSVVGQGSSFFVSLPKRGSQARA